MPGNNMRYINRGVYTCIHCTLASDTFKCRDLQQYSLPLKDAVLQAVIHYAQRIKIE